MNEQIHRQKDRDFATCSHSWLYCMAKLTKMHIFVWPVSGLHKDSVSAPPQDTKSAHKLPSSGVLSKQRNFAAYCTSHTVLPVNIHYYWLNVILLFTTLFSPTLAGRPSFTLAILWLSGFFFYSLHSCFG